ncbi:hypothetical protein VNO80_09936 [Phaseolus coccineus]|uniref:Uncharacterized protein n=1 Tax=Phaseolus coccineus TaxID=3886 RepID=A0AAN9N907_PHACN
MCKLWNLQILNLDDCKHLQKLPNSLIDLKSLEMLSFKGCHKLSSLPPQMGKLTSLRRLTSYFVGNEKGFLLTKLRGMKLKEDIDMKHLERVKSVNDVMEANMSIIGYTGGRLPRWVFGPSLKKLQIERCRELNALHEALDAMTALHSLRLYDLPNLESLPDCFQHLRSLRQISIGFCCKLTSFPYNVRVNALERLDIYACPALEKQLFVLSTTVLLPCKIRVDDYLITQGKLITFSYHMLYEVYQVFSVLRISLMLNVSSS